MGYEYYPHPNRCQSVKSVHFVSKISLSICARMRYIAIKTKEPTLPTLPTPKPTHKGPPTTPPKGRGAEKLDFKGMKIDTQAQKTDYQAPLPSGGVGGGLLGGGCQGWAWCGKCGKCGECGFFSLFPIIYIRRVLATPIPTPASSRNRTTGKECDFFTVT